MDFDGSSHRDYENLDCLEWLWWVLIDSEGVIWFFYLWFEYASYGWVLICIKSKSWFCRKKFAI